MQLYSFVANVTFEESLLHVLSVKTYSFVGIDIKIKIKIIFGSMLYILSKP